MTPEISSRDMSGKFPPTATILMTLGLTNNAENRYSSWDKSEQEFDVKSKTSRMGQTL